MDDNKIKQAVSDVKNKILKYDSEYSASSEKERENEKKWQSECVNVTILLDNLVMKINPKFKTTFDRILQSNRKNLEQDIKVTDWDFDKLLYFLDRVNEIDIPEHIIERNPSYCKTVLTTIADEYLRIKSYLSSEKINREKRTNLSLIELEKKYKQNIHDTWGHFCNVDMEKLANEQSQKTISDISRSV